MTASEFVTAAKALMQASPLDLETATKAWWTLGESEKWLLAVHVPAQSVGQFEKGWNALRRTATLKGLTIKLEVEVTLVESATWGMASGVPLTESASSTHGQFTVSPFINTQQHAEAA